MVYRLSRMLGIVCIVAGLMLGLAMFTADAFGTLGIPVGDSVVAILIVTMTSLTLWSLAYRVHPPWMSLFAKVASIELLATGLLYTMNRLLLLAAYSMARHANVFRFFPGGTGGTIYTDTRFNSANAGPTDSRSSDCHLPGRSDFPAMFVDLRRWLSMPTRASPSASFFRRVSPAASATSPHARFSLLS